MAPRSDAGKTGGAPETSAADHENADDDSARAEEERTSAAGKMQSARRGSSASKDASSQRAEAVASRGDDEEAQSPPALVEREVAEEGVAVEEMTSAATKIQSVHRGNVARRDVSARRAEAAVAPGDGEEDEEEEEPSAADKMESKDFEGEPPVAREQIPRQYAGEEESREDASAHVEESALAAESAQSVLDGSTARSEATTLQAEARTAREEESDHEAGPAASEEGGADYEAGHAASAERDVAEEGVAVEEMTTAAVKIQSVHRGNVARRDVSARRAEDASAPRAEDVSAERAEAVSPEGERGEEGPDGAADMGAAEFALDEDEVEGADAEGERVSAVVKIQSRQRGGAARTKLAEQHSAATTIQSALRGNIARKEVTDLAAERDERVAHAKQQKDASKVRVMDNQLSGTDPFTLDAVRLLRKYRRLAVQATKLTPADSESAAKGRGKAVKGIEAVRAEAAKERAEAQAKAARRKAQEEKFQVHEARRRFLQTLQEGHVKWKVAREELAMTSAKARQQEMDLISEEYADPDFAQWLRENLADAPGGSSAPSNAGRRLSSLWLKKNVQGPHGERMPADAALAQVNSEAERAALEKTNEICSKVIGQLRQEWRAGQRAMLQHVSRELTTEREAAAKALERQVLNSEKLSDAARECWAGELRGARQQLERLEQAFRSGLEASLSAELEAVQQHAADQGAFFQREIREAMKALQEEQAAPASQLRRARLALLKWKEDYVQDARRKARLTADKRRSAEAVNAMVAEESVHEVKFYNVHPSEVHCRKVNISVRQADDRGDYLCYSLGERARGAGAGAQSMDASNQGERPVKRMSYEPDTRDLTFDNGYTARLPSGESDVLIRKLLHMAEQTGTTLEGALKELPQLEEDEIAVDHSRKVLEMIWERLPVGEDERRDFLFRLARAVPCSGEALNIFEEHLATHGVLSALPHAGQETGP